jgi:hypothetical protein
VETVGDRFGREKTPGMQREEHERQAKRDEERSAQPGCGHGE